MRTLQYRVSLDRELPSDALTFLEAIPGVLAKSVPKARPDPLPYHFGSTLYIPPDARSLVRRLLTEWGVKSWWALHPGAPPRIPRTLEDIPGIRPEVVARVFPHQRDVVPFLDARDGGYIHWETGTGKTLEGVVFSAGDPKPDRRILVLTYANTTYQWQASFQQFTLPGVFHTHVLEGENSVRVIYPTSTRPTWVWITPHPEVGYYEVFPRRKKNPPDPGIWKDPSTIPANDRKRLVAAELLEEIPASVDILAQVQNVRTSEIVAEYTGREPLILDNHLYQQYAARAQAKGPTADPEAFVLSRPLGEDPIDVAERAGIPVEKALLFRARALAKSRVQAQRGVVDLPPGTDVILAGYPILPARREMLRAWKPTTVIFDEAQRLKAPEIYVSDVDGFGNERPILGDNWPASALYVAEHADRVLMASATPAPDVVRDWWSQLYILTRTIGRKRIFTDRYCGGQEVRVNEHHAHYDSSGSSNGEELEARIQFWTHRVSKDVIRHYLPKTFREVTKIPPERLAKVAISPEEWRTARAGGSIGLLELSILIAAAQKRPFLVARILEHLAGKDDLKVLVLGGRQVDADLTGRDLKAGGFTGDVWVAHGESHPDSKERYEMALAYRAHPGPLALIGTLDAWGTGVDGLQDTDRLIIPMLPWSPGKIDQGEGRVDRPDPLADLPFYRGKPRVLRESTIEYLWAVGTVDDRIGEVFLDKAAGIGVTYGELKNRIMALHDALAGGAPSEEKIEAIAARLLASFPDDFTDTKD